MKAIEVGFSVNHSIRELGRGAEGPHLLGRVCVEGGPGADYQSLEVNSH
jgi:hypothetical protein